MNPDSVVDYFLVAQGFVVIVYICVCCVHIVLLVAMPDFSNFSPIVMVSAFGDVLLSLCFARVWFVPSMLLLKLCSLFVSCVCVLVCLLVSSFARLLVRLLLCMCLRLYVLYF